MKILVTGAAGFIGFHIARKLLDSNFEVIGLDNINDYYDPQLKFDRLKELGVTKDKAEVFGQMNRSVKYPNFDFTRLAIEDKKSLENLFRKNHFTIVCNLAAQAGVRYSIDNPQAYIDSNINGFYNILECARNFNIKHLIYASSSSVYGLNTKVPFSTSDNVDFPISLYAATKKSNELMAHTYSHLFKFKTTGLRFFTVYGPWGRPDMAMFIFTKNIIEGQKIKVYNHGNMERDFTYIDDIIKGIFKIVETNIDDLKNYNIYNIGNTKSVKLLDFINCIEEKLGKKASKELLPIQPGDVTKTWADVSGLISDFDYSPNTPIKKGVSEFVDWYKNYYST